MNRWRAVLLCGAFAAAGCGVKSASSFETLTLPTASGAKTVALGQCPTPKCLTVFVAPWCGYCRAASPMIRALREHLAKRNVTTRIVVGMDREDSVRGYAAEFGPDTLIDPKGSIHLSGVPHFFASSADGKVFKDVAGAPRAPEELSEAFLEAVAGHLGV
ncbi:MAG: redoxin family protein [Elusimicrobia bacterium]|nr:redoxin family protein [Elusimicrobiota bacterium]